MELSTALKSASEKIIKLDKPIKIISHIDADGITAAAILIKTLKNLNLKFSLSIIRNLTDDFLQQLKKENYSNYIFLDLGSGNLQQINNILKNKNIFIFDHHIPQEGNFNLTHVNPHLFGFDGSKELSGAGITYLLSKTIDEKNKSLAYLAIIGAIGDMQEKQGFLGLNKIILQDALDSNKIEIITGLRMFGSQTRQLYKILQYSTDPYIPGITGNETSTLEFLKKLNLNKNKKLFELTQEETKTLVTAIILQRLGSEDTPEDVLGNIYLLKEEQDNSPTKDLKEFSTLLNSCGRLGKYSLGIGTCLNDENSKEKAIELLHDYKKEIITSLNWFYKNRKSPYIIEKENLTIINAEDNIRDTIIGTITSIISKSNLYPEKTILLSLAHTLDADTKISIRISGFKKNSINLKETLNNIVKKFDCKAGGHLNAAGSIIPQEKEQEFIELAQKSI